MEQVRVLFHVHTSSSFDGVLKLDRAIQYCKNNRVGVLIVTDHDVFQNAADLYESPSDVIVIPGIEFSSAAGDIIGISITEPIHSKNAGSLMRSVHEQGGLTVVPHPYKGHRLNSIPIGEVDLVEIFNPRCSVDENRLAAEWCNRIGKRGIVGVDAHIHRDLGDAINIYYVQNGFQLGNWQKLKQILLNAPWRFAGRYTPRWSVHLSQVVKGIKLRNQRILIRNLAKLILEASRLR